MPPKEWADIIATLGFPVVLCAVYVYDSRRARVQLEASREALERRIETLERESRTTLVGVINKNTEAMLSLNVSLKGRPCLAHEELPLGR